MGSYMHFGADSLKENGVLLVNAERERTVNLMKCTRKLLYWDEHEAK